MTSVLASTNRIADVLVVTKQSRIPGHSGPTGQTKQQASRKSNKFTFQFLKFYIRIDARSFTGNLNSSGKINVIGVRHSYCWPVQAVMYILDRLIPAFWQLPWWISYRHGGFWTTNNPIRNRTESNSGLEFVYALLQMGLICGSQIPLANYVFHQTA